MSDDSKNPEREFEDEPRDDSSRGDAPSDWEVDRRAFLGVSSATIASASWWGITARADAQSQITQKFVPPTVGSQNYAYDE